MARLPVDQSDNNSWGPILNDFLSVANNSDGSAKAPESYVLAASTSVADTSITLNQAPATHVATQQFVVVDAYTSQAEVKKLTAVAGAVVTIPAMEYAHTAGDRVLIVTGNTLTTAVWGCKGDGSTDDHTGLQEAIIQTAAAGLWLDGQNKTHIVSQPLVLPQNHRLKSVWPKAKSTFAPAEANNALGMSQNGNRRAFTADPTTNILTCSSAHAAPGDGQGVVLQGSNLPGGLTAGKFYYIYNRSGADFQVSETLGGGMVDITSAGSGGMAHFEVYAANNKSHMEECYWNGDQVAGLNGLLMSVQQQGSWDKVRVDRCPGYGVKFKGQQHVMYNFESINCNQAMVLDNMSFLYCYGFNAEQCHTGIYVESGGATSCHFYGAHFEMNSGSGYASASSIAIHLDNQAINMVFDGMNISMQTSGQTFFKADAASANATSYSLRNVRWSSGIGSTGQIMVNDVNRGVSLDQWDDCRGQLHLLEAPILPASQAYTDPNPILYIGAGGRRIAMASQNNDQASLRLRPSTTQTGDQFRADTTAGVRVSGFNKAGVLFTERNTVPADADLVAGELTFWFDDTNGAAKAMFKGKQADGTVRTGSVALT